VVWILLDATVSSRCLKFHLLQPKVLGRLFLTLFLRMISFLFPLLCSRLIFSHLVHPSGNESRRLDDVSSEASSLAWHVATHRLDGELQVSCRCASGFSASSRVPPGRRSLACAASMCACGSPAALQRILAWLLHVLPTSLLTF
jgi:hypothetical protein